MQTIGLKDIEQLYKIIRREDIATSVKMRAIRRIAEIYRQNPQEAESKAAEMVEALDNVIKKSTNDQSPINHFMLRAEACLALGSYDESNVASKAYTIIDTQLKNDKYLEVRSACAQSLGFFKKNKAEVGQKLLASLEAQLKADPIQDYDIRLTINIINSLGRLKYRDAFVALIKVLQSGYPPNVKKEAERAIKEINF